MIVIFVRIYKFTYLLFCVLNQVHTWFLISDDVLVLHTSIIKYIFEIYLGIICIAGGKNRKEIWKA